MIYQVIIASRNPVKINATKEGFKQMLPSQQFTYQGVSVPSGVNDQPMSFEETRQGAANRVINSKKQYPEANYWVGIEGGIEIIHDEWYAFAWVSILSRAQKGSAKTSNFLLPHRIVELIKSGKELGEADDIVFSQSNSKQKSGAIGLLTEDAIDRAQLYVPAVIAALIPFKNKELY